MEIMDKDPLIKNEEPEITDCGNGKFICGLCSKTFSSKQSLRQHYQEIHVGNNEKTIECLASGCTKKFAVERYMKEHMKKVHDKPKVPNPVPLQENSKERERYLMLEQYIGVNNDTSLEQCNVCQKSYKGAHRSTRLRQLFDHIERVHLKLRSYVCDYCSHTFNSKTQKASHISLKHREEHKYGRSNRCSDEYDQLHLMPVQVELNEEPFETEETPDPDYTTYEVDDSKGKKKKKEIIERVDQVISINDELLKAKRQACLLNSEVPKSSQIPENSKDKERHLMLEQYIEVNNDTSLEQCKVCQKSYKGAHRSTRLRQLFDHIERSHLKLRSYACDYCSQTFNSKGQKASHISMKHSSEHKSGRSARSSDKLKTEYAKLQLEEVELNEDPEQNELLEIEEEPEDDYDPDDVQEYDLADALKSKKEDSEISDPDSQVKLEDFLQVELEEDDNQSNLDYH